MSLQQVHSLGRVLAQALAFIHGKGQVHGSVQPWNIMIASGVVKLSDPLALVGLLLVAGIGLGRLPTRVDPVAYTPPAKPPLAGPLAPNQALAQAQLLAFGRIRGPEDVAVDREGRVCGGTSDVKIVRVRTDDSIEVDHRRVERPLFRQWRGPFP